MKQVSLWAIAGASLMLAGNAFGGGPVDKVTGEFSIAGCYECVPGDPLGLIRYRLVSAHEGNGRRDQKGFLYSEVDGNWYLIDFDNKILVMIQWAFNYVTRKRGARLITHEPVAAGGHPDRFATAGALRRQLRLRRRCTLRLVAAAGRRRRRHQHRAC